jgi:hypothetical protein
VHSGEAGHVYSGLSKPSPTAVRLEEYNAGSKRRSAHTPVLSRRNDEVYRLGGGRRQDGPSPHSHPPAGGRSHLPAVVSAGQGCLPGTPTQTVGLASAPTLAESAAGGGSSPGSSWMITERVTNHAPKRCPCRRRSHTKGTTSITPPGWWKDTLTPPLSVSCSCTGTQAPPLLARALEAYRLGGKRRRDRSLPAPSPARRWTVPPTRGGKCGGAELIFGAPPTKTMGLALMRLH